MYLPPAFTQNDLAEVFALVAAHPFATLITAGGGDVGISHLPLLVDAERRTLSGHLARENSQFEHLAAGVPVVAIFHGPHGYVSPSSYVDRGPSVPTWNYVVVHVHGRPRIVDEPELRRILSAMVERFDATGWQLTRDDEYLGRSLAVIAGFELSIERVEGKWKLSQNRSVEDRRGVVNYLASGDASSRALAALMRSKL